MQSREGQFDSSVARP
nr:unnamed protein product [Callosobruchus chinensis]